MACMSYIYMLHDAVSPAQPAKRSPGRRSCLLRRHQVYDRIGSVYGSGGAAPLAARRICPGAPPAPQAQGRVFVGQAARCGGAGLPNDSAQTPLIGAFSLLCAAVAIPLILRNPRQVCAVGVCGAITACNSVKSSTRGPIPWLRGQRNHSLRSFSC